MSLVFTLPAPSSTATTGDAANVTPSATPPTGWVVNTSLLAAPAVMTTLLEAPVDVRPDRVATSVYVPAAPVPVIWQFANEATPATAAIVGKPLFEHDRAPAGGPLEIASVTFPVSP